MNQYIRTDKQKGKNFICNECKTMKESIHKNK